MLLTIALLSCISKMHDYRNQIHTKYMFHYTILFKYDYYREKKQQE